MFPICLSQRSSSPAAMKKSRSVARHLPLAVALSLVCTHAPANTPLGDKPGVDTVFFDTKAAACDDFYRYATGNWQDASKIPGDRARWGAFDEIEERNRVVLKAVLEVAQQSPRENALKKKLGNFYASGLNADKVDAKSKLAAALAVANEPAYKRSIAAAFARMHQQGTPAGFNFSVRQDQKNSSRYIVQLFQGGLGLPEREYYFSKDERSAKQREAYVAHIEKMLSLSGMANSEAKAAATNIMALETALAEASMTRVEARDPDKTYQLMTVPKLEALAPNIAWRDFFSTLGIQDVGDINIGQPKFFEALSALTKETPQSTWRAYHTWHILRTLAPHMGGEFEQENFTFYGKNLTGVESMEPREKRVIATIDRAMGEALGQLYVEKAFSPTAKAKALDLVKNVRLAMRDRIDALDWMSAETKKEAIGKLDAIAVKIGYPDKWKDYSAVDIKADDYLGNVIRATRVEFQRQIDRLGKPIDRNAWFMSPSTVNAYYNASINEIVFPAGILQSPFFDERADDASNYGGIGMVIGHELTHGFDDRGRKFDAIGNRRDWWTAEDAKRYTAKADAIARQYDAFTPLAGMNINGRATLGENIADFGGLRVAFLGLQKAIDANKDAARKIGGLSAEQRFFVNYAQSWRQNIREAELVRRLKTDSHSPARYRVLGPLGNLPEFQQAFACKAGDRMVRAADEQVSVW
jgi:putative endopeptidase